MHGLTRNGIRYEFDPNTSLGFIRKEKSGVADGVSLRI